MGDPAFLPQYRAAPWAAAKVGLAGVRLPSSHSPPSSVAAGAALAGVRLPSSHSSPTSASNVQQSVTCLSGSHAGVEHGLEMSIYSTLTAT